MKLLSDSIDLALGLLAMSREKIEGVVENLVQRGEVSKRDAQTLVSDLVTRGEQQRESVKALVEQEVLKSVSGLGLARKDDVPTKEQIESIVRTQIMQALREAGLVGGKAGD